MAFEVDDKVRLTEESAAYRSGTSPLKPGTVYTVRYSDEHRTRLHGFNESGMWWFTSRFEKVADAIKVGDKVRLVNPQPSEPLEKSIAPLEHGRVYTVTEVSQEDGWTKGELRVVVDGIRTTGGHPWFARRFEKVAGEKPVNKTGAMGFDEARRQRQRLIDEGAALPDNVRLVTRTWDNEGRFAAVDILSDGVRVRHFQNVQQIDAFLVAQRPIDVEPYYISGIGGEKQYYFYVPGTTTVIPPEGNRYTGWWNMAMIEAAGGIVTFNGQKYRLGERRFVPFVGKKD